MVNEPLTANQQRDEGAPMRDRIIHEKQSAASPTSPARTAVVAERSSATDARKLLTELSHEFHDHVIRFNELGAQSVLFKIQRLVQEHPEQFGPGTVEYYFTQFDRLARRGEAFMKHINELNQRAVLSAQRGDAESTARALRRLSTIHAARPQYLSEASFRQMRDNIIQASDVHEHHQAVHDLVTRERSVATEIRNLADMVHRFQMVAHHVSHDSEEYREAETKFEKAVREIRSHDTEWLAALTLELLELLEESHEPAVEHQLDRFLETVRSSLLHLREEVREIDTEMRPNA